MVVVSSTINIRDQQWDFEGNSHVFVVCRFFVLSSSLFGHFWINHGPGQHLSIGFSSKDQVPSRLRIILRSGKYSVPLWSKT